MDSEHMSKKIEIIGKKIDEWRRASKSYVEWHWVDMPIDLKCGLAQILAII